MDKSNIQSVVFEKRLYTSAKARKWLSANGFSMSEGELHESDKSVRFSVRGLDQFVVNTVASKSCAQGVQIVTGKVKAKEAIASGANSPLLKAKVHENATITAPVSAGVYKVILISEGLGNRENMNYYGPEAIASAPAIFEGKPAYKNHPSESEEQDIPERRVEDQIGFFKNCKVETIDGRRACTAELHLEGTPVGIWARQKLDFALLYRKQFPKSEDEYCGFSVAAAGESEKRVMAIDGQQENTNYLMAFTGARSCDMVTTPARGGKVLQVLESQRGLNSKEKKTAMNELIKQINDEMGKLDAALSADEKADAGVKAAAANLKTLCAGLSTPEAEAAPDKPAADPAADPAPKEGEEGNPVMSDAPAGEKPAAPAPAAAPDKPAANPVPAPAKKEGMEAEGCDEAEESQKLAVKFLLNEAGPEVLKIVGDKMPATLKEAKTRIADIKATLKAVRESNVVPAGNPAKPAATPAPEYTPKL